MLARPANDAPVSWCWRGLWFERRLLQGCSRCSVRLTCGDRTIGKVSTPAKEVRSPVSYCPRSSLPVEVLTYLDLPGRAPRPPAAARPPGLGGTRPLSLEVRLDAVAAVILDGLSYRRAGRAVGISKTEVGDSLDLLLGALATLGSCQPDGTFITTLADLGEHLVEMARSGEAVCVDGLATRVQRPRSWGNQKMLYDAKRHTTPPRACRCPRSGVTCCGWMVACATKRCMTEWG
jgi:hypothetical protein